MTIGLIKEGKTPSDSRVALTPAQCKIIQNTFGFKILVEPSTIRAFADEEYTAQGIELSHDLENCDVLLGIKEVPIAMLKAGKTYFFFSHTIKEQAKNCNLLRAIIEKKITLIDYEVLKDARGARLIAFGKFAGMVGAHNGLSAYGLKTKTFNLPRLKDLQHYVDVLPHYEKTNFGALRIVLTGHGRVANGVIQVLMDAGFTQVNPYDYLNRHFDSPVFTQLKPVDYATRFDRVKFDKADFYTHPEKYISIFAPYTRYSDVFINCIFFENNAPPFFTAEEMRAVDFSIKVIADISCDIAPEGSVPSTLFATTIENPFYDYDPTTEKAVPQFSEKTITVMSIDNLPNELPRDASLFFGEQFIEHIVQHLKNPENSPVLQGGTIAKNGALTDSFKYLSHYVGAVLEKY